MNELDNLTIGEIILMVLYEEGEELDEVIYDYEDYSTMITEERITDLTLMHVNINDTQEFKALLSVFHKLISKYTSGENHQQTTVAGFLADGFYNYSYILLSKT